MSDNLIKKHSIEEHRKSLADYYPNDKLFAGKNENNSTPFLFLKGSAHELQRTESYLISFQQEYLPDETSMFLEDWERALGIPDDCFDGVGTLDERRRDVLVKLASLGIQTVADFQGIADFFGITATVIPGQDFSPLPPDPKYTIVVTYTAGAVFPFTFPFSLGTEAPAILECLFNKLKPANCVVQFTAI